ncbi:MAG TPA: hypothetical protein VF627_15175 [Abditibacterium sp.]|jgi:hypothetical protein
MTFDSASPRFIPDRWKPLVEAHVKQDSGEWRGHLSADSFRTNRYVRIFFADNSFALFHYAFCLRSEELQEVAIFTEHCGYYFYSTVADMVSVEELEAI